MKKNKISLNFFLKIPFLSFFLLFSSCISSGDKFSSDLSWIENLKTNQQDVKMVLGTPYSVGNSGGIVTWTYAFYQYVFPSKTYYKELRFYWGSDKRVKNFSFNSSFPEDLSRVNIGSGIRLERLSHKRAPANKKESK